MQVAAFEQPQRRYEPQRTVVSNDRENGTWVRHGRKLLMGTAAAMSLAGLSLGTTSPVAADAGYEGDEIGSAGYNDPSNSFGGGHDEKSGAEEREEAARNQNTTSSYTQPASVARSLTSSAPRADVADPSDDGGSADAGTSRGNAFGAGLDNEFDGFLDTAVDPPPEEFDAEFEKHLETEDAKRADFDELNNSIDESLGQVDPSRLTGDPVRDLIDGDRVSGGQLGLLGGLSDDGVAVSPRGDGSVVSRSSEDLLDGSSTSAEFDSGQPVSVTVENPRLGLKSSTPIGSETETNSDSEAGSGGLAVDDPLSAFGGSGPDLDSSSQVAAVAREEVPSGASGDVGSDQGEEVAFIDSQLASDLFNPPAGLVTSAEMAEYMQEVLDENEGKPLEPAAYPVSEQIEGLVAFGAALTPVGALQDLDAAIESGEGVGLAAGMLALDFTPAGKAGKAVGAASTLVKASDRGDDVVDAVSTVAANDDLVVGALRTGTDGVAPVVTSLNRAPDVSVPKPASDRTSIVPNAPTKAANETVGSLTNRTRTVGLGTVAAGTAVLVTSDTPQTPTDEPTNPSVDPFTNPLGDPLADADIVPFIGNPSAPDESETPDAEKPVPSDDVLSPVVGWQPLTEFASPSLPLEFQPMPQTELDQREKDLAQNDPLYGVNDYWANPPNPDTSSPQTDRQLQPTEPSVIPNGAPDLAEPIPYGPNTDPSPLPGLVPETLNTTGDDDGPNDGDTNETDETDTSNSEDGETNEADEAASNGEDATAAIPGDQEPKTADVVQLFAQQPTVATAPPDPVDVLERLEQILRNDPEGANSEQELLSLHNQSKQELAKARDIVAHVESVQAEIGANQIRNVIQESYLLRSTKAEEFDKISTQLEALGVVPTPEQTSSLSPVAMTEKEARYTQLVQEVAENGGDPTALNEADEEAWHEIHDRRHAEIRNEQAFVEYAQGIANEIWDHKLNLAVDLVAETKANLDIDIEVAASLELDKLGLQALLPNPSIERQISNLDEELASRNFQIDYDLAQFAASKNYFQNMLNDTAIPGSNERLDESRARTKERDLARQEMEDRHQGVDFELGNVLNVLVEDTSVEAANLRKAGSSVLAVAAQEELVVKNDPTQLKADLFEAEFRMKNSSDTHWVEAVNAINNQIARIEEAAPLLQQRWEQAGQEYEAAKEAYIAKHGRIWTETRRGLPLPKAPTDPISD